MPSIRIGLRTLKVLLFIITKINNIKKFINLSKIKYKGDNERLVFFITYKRLNLKVFILGVITYTSIYRSL